MWHASIRESPLATPENGKVSLLILYASAMYDTSNEQIGERVGRSVFLELELSVLLGSTAVLRYQYVLRIFVYFLMLFFYGSDEVGPPVLSSVYPWRISGNNLQVRVWFHHFFDIFGAHVASTLMEVLG